MTIVMINDGGDDDDGDDGEKGFDAVPNRTCTTEWYNLCQRF